MTGWECMYMRYSPVHGGLGKRADSLQSSHVVFVSFSTYSPQKAYLTKKKGQIHKTFQDHLANAEITGMVVSKYYCINVIFPAESPPDIGPSLFPLAAAGLTTTIFPYVYTYTFI